MKTHQDMYLNTDHTNYSLWMLVRTQTTVNTTKCSSQEIYQKTNKKGTKNTAYEVNKNKDREAYHNHNIDQKDQMDSIYYTSREVYQTRTEKPKEYSPWI